MTHQNSNIYNAVAERPPENNGFYWLTPNAPLKILGKIGVAEQTTLKY